MFSLFLVSVFLSVADIPEVVGFEAWFFPFFIAKPILKLRANSLFPVLVTLGILVSCTLSHVWHPTLLPFAASCTKSVNDAQVLFQSHYLILALGSEQSPGEYSWWIFITDLSHWNSTLSTSTILVYWEVTFLIHILQRNNCL